MTLKYWEQNKSVKNTGFIDPFIDVIVYLQAISQNELKMITKLLTIQKLILPQRDYKQAITMHNRFILLAKPAVTVTART